MSDYTIGNGTLLNIANALRAQEGSSGTIPVADIATRIAALEPEDKKTGSIDNPNTSYYGISSSTISAIGNALKGQDDLTGPVSGFAQRILNLCRHWVRPSGWPDYTKVDRSNDDAVYFTIDTESESTQNINIACFSWYGYDYRAGRQSTVNDIEITRGYIDSTGYHVVETLNYSYGRYTVPTDAGKYIVMRIQSKENAKLLSVSITNGQVLEAWGHAQHLRLANFNARTLISWDILCEGYVTENQEVHALNQQWGTANSGCALQNINFDGINWNLVSQITLTNSYVLNYVSYIKQLDLSMFANKTLHIGSTTYTQLFSHIPLKKVIIPTMTLVLENNSEFSEVFANTELSGVLDLSNVTIIRDNENQTYINRVRNWFNSTRITTLYCPTFTSIVPNKTTFSHYFSGMSYCEEIYNVPDFYVKTTTSGNTTQYITKSPNLSRETLVRIFNKMSALAEPSGGETYVANIVSIPTGLMSKLTTADIAILTDKGHTLASNNYN